MRLKNSKRPRNKRPHIIAMIPAKLGSTRLKSKNMALIGGKPLIYYAIKAARESAAFDRIVINAEDIFFSKIAKRYGTDFYKRPDDIVRPDTKTDIVVYDFLKHNPCDIVAWVSPIAPLQTPKEVADIVAYFLRNRLDSLMTVKDAQVHCLHNKRPVNFRIDGIFAQTQDLMPVQFFVYSVMMWRRATFVQTYEERGHALLCGKIGYYPVNKLSSIIIKTKEDLMLADFVLSGLSNGNYNVRYDRSLEEMMQ